MLIIITLTILVVIGIIYHNTQIPKTITGEKCHISTHSNWDDTHIISVPSSYYKSVCYNDDLIAELKILLPEKELQKTRHYKVYMKNLKEKEKRDIFKSLISK